MSAVESITDPTTGTEWNIRIVLVGDHYGLNDMAVNKYRAMAEIYQPQEDDGLGWRVSSYTVGTLAEGKGGIALDGSRPDLFLSAEGVRAVLLFAVKVMGG